MHADELELDVALVRRLLAEELPRLAHLPLRRVVSAGTDNAIFRLGDELAVRLPTRAESALRLEKELRWLPRLAPSLPLPVPVPFAAGAPAAGYPFAWAVLRWLDGDDAAAAPFADPRSAARTLARFVAALRRGDAAGAPGPGAHNSQRGAALAVRDAQVRAALTELGDAVDTAAATAAWEAALAAPAFAGRPAWLHGDLIRPNLLVRGGRLAGVVDFGCLGAGDPACDLLAGWACLPRGARRLYEDGLETDEAARARGRGWALSWALIALPYYARTNPALAAEARRTLDAVLADAGTSPGPAAALRGTP
jgi:aminoglycoside phosphotransferase (APT) family kinase protein